MISKNNRLKSATLVMTLALAACGGGGSDVSEGLSGSIEIDGSSTVYPITEAVAEEFRAVAPQVRVTVGVSGTGGGFSKFCRQEVDIANASRPIKQSEIDLCRNGQVQFIELPVAYDGIAVVVNPQNTWVDQLTVDELKRLWEPAAQGQIQRWNQVRSDWPDQEIRLFGPGVDSGTYDYFTQAVVGEEGASRGDFTSSEDDNVLVQGVASDQYALGFFGFAYYSENRDKLKIVPIIGQGGEAVVPTPETIASGRYAPLSRPVFIYVRGESAQRPPIQRFIEFYLKEGRALVPEVGYISLPEQVHSLALERFKSGTPGSLFEGGGSQVGVSVEDLLRTGSAPQAQ